VRRGRSGPNNLVEPANCTDRNGIGAEIGPMTPGGLTLGEMATRRWRRPPSCA